MEQAAMATTSERIALLAEGVACDHRPTAGSHKWSTYHQTKRTSRKQWRTAGERWEKKRTRFQNMANDRRSDDAEAKKDGASIAHVIPHITFSSHGSSSLFDIVTLTCLHFFTVHLSSIAFLGVYLRFCFPLFPAANVRFQMIWVVVFFSLSFSFSHACSPAALYELKCIMGI